MKTAVAAERKMARWRRSYHWATTEGKLSCAFMFGMAVQLGRTLLVLELTPDGEKFVDPGRACGMRDAGNAGGVLRRSVETVPFYFTIKLADLETVLRSDACSLLQYNRDGVHFQAIVRDIAWTEAADEEVAALNAEMETEDAAMEGGQMEDAVLPGLIHFTDI